MRNAHHFRLQNNRDEIPSILLAGRIYYGKYCVFIQERIKRYKMCIDQGFPRSGEEAQILVGPISKKVEKV